MGPEGLKFNKPVTVTVPLSAAIDVAVWGVTIPILRFDPAQQRWVPETTALIDPVASTLTFQLTEFKTILLPEWAEVCQAIAGAIQAVTEKNFSQDSENGTTCSIQERLD